MSKMKWKTKEEIEEGKGKIPTVGELQAKIEQMQEEKKLSDLALLELTQMLLRWTKGGE
ncbi:hypothetical protein NSQ82_07820 [Caldifermentibacillus hisashii]|uniref:hypothetical protein n=1 Tax=Caldifermentibacillus hisashii TaxID=996558 RepID=UPI0031B73092